ncbi:NADH dehydrogenase [Ktedonospora formicarum]|uniref:NADH:ubiquinone reductase (non-electrogenic) n=2 Tax=Ktedonospora formicarum TaxID=2778364 RepID=A0A8J3MVT8_9CHLR|nr:NADH dehydrogenase [Ktedonospora formicarum]
MTPVEVVVIDRDNYHLFQPMLYQVATAGLPTTVISAPIREILHKQANTRVMLAEVTGVDVERRQVVLRGQLPLSYDYLIIATGASANYFQHPEWGEIAPSMKTLEDALAIRSMLLSAFEQAELEPDEEKRRALLTFVLVGAGPTGVELAGSIAELANKTLARDFRHLRPSLTRIMLVDAMPRILPTLPKDLARSAEKQLRHLGVELHVGKMVTDVSGEGITFGGEFVATRAVIWTAGVLASPAGVWLGTEVDHSGRVKVTTALTLQEHDNIFVIGDTACVLQGGKPLPGVAQVAIQEGEYVAEAIQRQLQGEHISYPFHYVDKGTMAMVGRAYALAAIGRLHIAGLIGWLLWVGIHIYNLISFRNRFIVTFQYALNYLTYQRSARIIYHTPDGGKFKREKHSHSM